MSESLIFHDVVCCGCSCLCDDLQVTVDAAGKMETTAGCSQAAKYLQKPADGPGCLIDGEAATLEAGIAAAQKLLSEAQASLFLGLGELTIDGQRGALDWADQLGAYVDAGNPAEPDPSGVILQSTGMITATLGEIRDRADVLLFWNADPAVTQPRFFERFALDAGGRFLTGPRTALSIDAAPTATTNRTDVFCQAPISANLDVAHALLALGRGRKIDAARFPLLAEVAAIHAKLSSANYAAIICGPSLYGGADGAAIVETLADYVRDLNRTNRAIISLLRSGPNWIGAAESIAWRTGYPSPIRFAADGPAFDPTGYRAAKLLARGQVDAVVRFDGQWLQNISAEMSAALEKLPTVAFGWSDAGLPAQVAFRVAKPGVECGGSMHRMDDVPLPLTQLVQTSRLTTEAVIRRAIV